jgi:hypothetical protein
MLKTATVTLFLLLIAAACAQTAIVPARPADGSSPQDALLRRVKGTLALFPPDERATLLIHLVNTRPDSGSVEAGEWTQEIFRLTHELRSIERMNVEANALIAYSRLDSTGALELLKRMEISSSPGNGYDFREKAASEVFQRFLDDHPGETAGIEEAMRKMGDDGVFPFRAAAGIVRRLARHEQQPATRMVRDAVYYYNHGPRTHFFDLEFAAFLVEGAQNIPAAVSKGDLQPLLANAIDLHGEPHAVWGNQFAEPGIPATGRIAAEAFLTNLLPLIHTVDPELEARLKEEHPALTQARSKKGRKAKAAAAELARALATQDELADRTAPQLALNEIHSLAAGDAAKALRIRSGIQDAAWRAAAGADIAVMLHSIDPERANQLLEEAERQARHTSDPQNKLRITAALGRAYMKLRRHEAFASAITRMFKLADETFARFSHEAPKCAWASLPGARELAPLTREAAAFAPQMMLEQIDGMQTPLLQTHLLISMMEGMNR